MAPRGAPVPGGGVILFTFAERPPALSFAPISWALPEPLQPTHWAGALGAPPLGHVVASQKPEVQGSLASCLASALCARGPLLLRQGTPLTAVRVSALLQGRSTRGPQHPEGSHHCTRLQLLRQTHCGPQGTAWTTGPPQCSARSPAGQHLAVLASVRPPCLPSGVSAHATKAPPLHTAALAHGPGVAVCGGAGRPGLCQAAELLACADALTGPFQFWGPCLHFGLCVAREWPRWLEPG